MTRLVILDVLFNKNPADWFLMLVNLAFTKKITRFFPLIGLHPHSPPNYGIMGMGSEVVLRLSTVSSSLRLDVA